MIQPITPAVLRVAIFATLLVGLVLAEMLLAGPNPAPKRRRRWPGNAMLGILTALIGRFALPAGLGGAALWAHVRGFGVFNATAWPQWIEFVLSLLLLDCAIYWQHRLLHALPWLWRLHRVHHTDVTLDATSALRFHPLEIALSLAIKLLLVIALGIPIVAILVFEMLLSSFALLTHANLSLPPKLDHALRRLLVTPAMHRIHHSTRHDEQQRNFGFNLSVWDHLFRSYASRAHDAPQLFGVQGVPASETTRWWRLLREPFAIRDVESPPNDRTDLP